MKTTHELLQPSADPLVLKAQPSLGEPHPKAPQFRAVQVRLMDSADIEGKVIYSGPKNWQVTECFVLRCAA